MAQSFNNDEEFELDIGYDPADEVERTIGFGEDDDEYDDRWNNEDDGWNDEDDDFDDFDDFDDEDY
jgi:hypothetical protein